MTTPAPIMVRFEHIRAARFCTAGAREWLKLHGVDPLEMIRTGIPIERIESFGDELGLRVAAIAREQNALERVKAGLNDGR